MFYQHNMGTGGWVFMVLGNIVIWGLLIAFILWLAQDLRSRPHRTTSPRAPATEILDRRLATGELNADEYKHLRATLAQTPSEQPPRIREAAGAPR